MKSSEGKFLVFLVLVVFMVFLWAVPCQAQTIGYEIPTDEYTYTNDEHVVAKEDNAGVDSVWGVYSDHDLILFNNTATGSISAYGEVGNATNYNYAEVSDIVGVYINGGVESFTNSGTISATATAGSAIGDGSYVDVGSVYGAYFNDTVGSFTNTGTISVSATAGNASGSGSHVGVQDIYGVFFNNGVNSFNNSGNIGVYVKAGENAQISNIASLYTTGNGSLTNTGTISLVVDAPETATVDGASAIYLENFSGSFSNTGKLYSSGNTRALSLYSSNLTLQDGFGYVFHGDPDSILRPIYVDSVSTLNLNNVDLLVYTGNDLVLGKPYYLIENNGTINNTWGSLVKKFTNPEISVDWYDQDRGANSAVVFKYTPQKSIAAPGISSGMLTGLLSFNQVGSFISGMTMPITRVAEEKPVMFAQLGTDVPITITKEGKNRFFILPIYSRINADDLGYRTNLYGLELGYERQFSSLRLGGFAGFGYTDVDFTGTYDLNSEKQRYFNLGAYGVYELKDFYILALAGWQSTNQKYSGYTGVNFDIPEKDNYHSNTFLTKLEGGYKVKLNNFRITPIMGLNYIYHKTPAHETEAALSSWNRSISEFSQDIYEGYIGLNLLAETKKDVLAYFGFIDARVAQVFNNNDIAITQSIPGIGAMPVKVTQDISNTTFRGSIGAGIRGDKMDLTFTFSPEINSDYKAYTGWVRLGIKF